MTPLYDQKTKGFRTVREERDDGYICSCSTKWYQDALTLEEEVHLSDEYIERNLYEVGPIDKFERAEYDEDVQGWRIAGSL